MQSDGSEDERSPPGSPGSHPASITVFNREGPVLFTGVLVCLGPKCFAVPPNDPNFLDEGLDTKIAILLKDEENDIVPYEQVRVQVVGDSVLVTLLDATGPAAVSSNKLAQDLLLLSLNPNSELYSNGMGKLVGVSRHSGDKWKDGKGKQPGESRPPTRAIPSVPKTEHAITLPRCRQVVGEAQKCLEESMRLIAELGKEVEMLQSAELFNDPSTALGTRLGPNDRKAPSRLNDNNGMSEWSGKQSITGRNSVNSSSVVPESRLSHNDRKASGSRLSDNDSTAEQAGNQSTRNRGAVMAQLEDALAVSRRSLHKTALNSSLAEGIPASRHDEDNSFLSESSIAKTPNSRLTWNPRGIRELGQSQNLSSAWDSPGVTQTSEGKHRSLDGEYQELLKSRLPFRHEWEQAHTGISPGTSHPQHSPNPPFRLHTASLRQGSAENRERKDEDALRRVDERVSRILTSLQGDKLDQSGIDYSRRADPGIVYSRRGE